MVSNHTDGAVLILIGIIIIIVVIPISPGFRQVEGFNRRGNIGQQCGAFEAFSEKVSALWILIWLVGLRHRGFQYGDRRSDRFVSID